MFLQLGLGGAALLVLHLHLRQLPSALKPISDALGEIARQHGKLGERMARIESKFDAAYDLTPIETPAMMQRQRDKTPVQGVPIPGGAYRVHKARDG